MKLSDDVANGNEVTWNVPIDGTRRGSAGCLVIGIVNNTPPAAMRKTELQFTSLLAAAAQDRDVRLRFFAPSGRAHQAAGLGSYDDLETLWESSLDGLIVTGAEPRSDRMTDEPGWPDLEKLVEWSSVHTISAIWSCLAAHAAVFKLDGLNRQPLPTKLSGVFDCVKASDHVLVSRSASHWAVPHSRHNDLDEAALIRRGYTILSHSPRIGVDMFAKQAGQSLFVLMQGHPEYDPQSLFREYRRDVRRYLLGQRQDYPALPESYFSQEMVAQLNARRGVSLRTPHIDLACDSNMIVQRAWRCDAVKVYAQWVSYLADRKAELFGGLDRDMRRAILHA